MAGLKPEEPLDGTLFGKDQLCFGCGPAHPAGFRLKFEREGDGVVTRFTPGHHHQGPPGIMHGGLVSTVADEAAAWALIVKRGKFGFTTSFSCRFVRALRVGVEAEAHARLTKESSRLVKCAVSIRQDGEECYTGEFTFVLLERGTAERLLRAPMPDAWARFCR
jgi:acyl-coenzyme A thioesterase PaaI-like protein